MKKYLYVPMPLCACFWMSMFGIANSSETQVILDEIVAGSDANYSLIEHGVAEYSISVTRFQPNRKTHTETVTVYFDGNRTRSDSGQERTIVDEDRVIEYMAPYPDPGAIVRTKNFAHPFKVHPKMQGLDEPGCVSDVIKALRDNSKCGIQVTREEGGLIKVVSLWESVFAKDEYWIDPNQGYCVVRFLKWGLKTPELPYVEIDSEFKKTDNGAFVLSNGRVVKRIAEPQDKRLVLHDISETEVSLLNINLSDKPDPAMFTIGGLELPQKCRIQDRVNGKEYLFGVSAVNEEGIGRPAVRGPVHSSRIVILIASAILFVIIATLCVWRRRKLRT